MPTDSKESNIYFYPKLLAALRKQFDAISPSTWHKIMHPNCVECLAERRERLLRRRKNGN
jgi:hypothetical protein